MVLAGASPALAGGLFLPGAGAESTSRAGASTVACDDGECLALNPANLMKTTGTTVTISAVAISYAMSFSRSGTYDTDNENPEPYNGQPFPTVTNASKPKLGFGSYQPVPVIAVTSDFGGAIPNFRGAIGIYAPNAYPFRSMGENYHFPTSGDPGDLTVPPTPTRYDIIHQDAAVLLPSIAVAYRPIPELDVGARFSWGLANLESKTTIWANSGNVIESVQHDGTIDVKAKDNFAPTFGVGATYRVTPEIEIGANYNYKISLDAKGDATAVNGLAVALNGNPIIVGPSGKPLCAAGGTFEKQKACVYLDLPMTAQLGGRYKFLDKDGKTVGDIELDLDWEHWGADRVKNYQVVVDAAAYLDMNTPVLSLKPTVIHHGLQDTYAARLGGSYVLALDEARGDSLVFRGGVGYDTRAAEDGWYRADIDGAARTTIAAGVGYKLKTWEVNAGGGVILEGTNTNPGTCNPTLAMPGCDGSGKETPVAGRHGPDPSDPTITDGAQVQSPFNQGSIKSHYVMFMLGASKQF